MKYIKPINEIWGPVLKRDLLGETREEDKFRSKDDLIKHLKSEIKKQGKNVVIQDIDASLIEDLSELFCGITNGVKSLDLSGWRTSGAKNMSGMFWGGSTIESLNISGWDTSNVEDMCSVFYGCKSLKSIDLSSWDTSNVKEMNNMFFDCMSLKSLDLSVWKTPNVENISWMFGCCRNLASLNLSGWDTPKLKITHSPFYDCPAPYEVINNKIVKK